MKYLTIACGTDSRRADGTKKSDSSSVFRPFAERFRSMYHPDEPVHYFRGDETPAKRRAWFLDLVKTQSSIDCFTYFGHGYTDGLQLGFRGTKSFANFASELGVLGVKKAIFYACSMGAKTIPIELKAKCQTLELCFTHVTAGHAVFNPAVRVDLWKEDRIETIRLDKVASTWSGLVLNKELYRQMLREPASREAPFGLKLPFIVEGIK